MTRFLVVLALVLPWLAIVWRDAVDVGAVGRIILLVLGYAEDGRTHAETWVDRWDPSPRSTAIADWTLRQDGSSLKVYAAERPTQSWGLSMAIGYVLDSALHAVDLVICFLIRMWGRYRRPRSTFLFDGLLERDVQ